MTKDLKNKKFGFLTAIKIVGKSHYGNIWECRCDCGKIIQRTAVRILRVKNPSCGCAMKGENHHNWSGYKGIIGSIWNDIVFRAKARNKKINITKKYIWDLFEKQLGKCYLSGESIYLAKNTAEWIDRKNTASLDCIDPKKGYVKGNVQWVHKKINMMKHLLDVKDFILWCHKISKGPKETDVYSPESSNSNTDEKCCHLPMAETQEYKGKNNIAGIRVYDLEVKRFIGNNLWECVCKCGKTTIVETWRLTGKYKKKSCGCRSLGKNHYLWKGHEKITGHYWKHIRKDAAKRNIPLKITIKEAWEKFENQKGLCSLTKVPIYFPRNSTTEESKYTASLDRIDSSKGYVIDNIQWVHKDINMMKHKYSQDDFIDWCRKVSKFQEVSVE